MKPYLYIPKSLRSELSENDAHELSYIAAKEVVKRTRFSGFFIAICFYLGSSISDFSEQHLYLHTLLLSLSILAAIARFSLAFQLPEESEQLKIWQWKYSLSVFFTAFIWFVFMVFHVFLHSFDQTTFVLLIASAGFIGTLTATLFIWRYLCFVYLLLVGIPMLMAVSFADVELYHALLIGFFIYFFFLFSQVISANKQYWQSLQNTLLLKKQTKELLKAKEEAEHADHAKTQFLS